LLFVPTDRISHLTPSLRSGQLLTNVQVNNITTLHGTHGHTYIHHIGITILHLFTLLPLFLAGRLAQTLPVWNSYLSAAKFNKYEPSTQNEQSNNEIAVFANLKYFSIE
jgi:hypothetical protein